MEDNVRALTEEECLNIPISKKMKSKPIYPDSAANVLIQDVWKRGNAKRRRIEIHFNSSNIMKMISDIMERKYVSNSQTEDGKKSSRLKADTDHVVFEAEEEDEVKEAKPQKVFSLKKKKKFSELRKGSGIKGK